MADHSEIRQLVEYVVLVPPGANLIGNTTSTIPQQLLIEGGYAGSIDLVGASHLVIAEGADVQADRVAAHTVSVYGRFDGHIHAQVVELGERARITGSIRYDSTFNSKPGARIRANLEGPDGDSE